MLESPLSHHEKKRICKKAVEASQASPRTSLSNLQISQFNGKNYKYWFITMKALFYSQDIWDLVENGF